MQSSEARQRRQGNQASEIKGRTKTAVTSEDEAVEKASRGWIQAFFVSFFITVLVSVSVFILMPSPVKPVEAPILAEPPELIGALEPNDVLTYAERIYQDKLSGPESVVVDGDHIYTGAADGWVYHIHKGTVEKLVTFGKKQCGGMENENTCGRPLGMRMDKDGFLVVVDSYYGLFRVNVVTRDVTLLYSTSTPVNGRKVSLCNDLDIGPDGKIYFSHSSSTWQRNEFPKILWEGAADGRLLVYDPKTGKTTQLLDGLFFANGVQLTRDKSAVLVAETFRARIMKYDLATKKALVWADNLPGTPDNIRYCKNTGTYWVGMAIIRQKEKFSMLDFVLPRPFLRGMLAKLFNIRGILWLKNNLSRTDTTAMALELNESGKIIRSIQDKTGAVIEGVSEVGVADGVMYFGSFHADYIGRLYKRKVPGL